MRKFCFAGSAVYAAIASLFIIIVLPQPAYAKSLFESIFGFLGTKPDAPAPRRAVPRRAPPGAAAPRFHAGPQRANPFQPRQARPRSYPASRSGRYKTVCVRLCDGYYFPISNTSRRRDFYDDAQRCQSRCDSEARLFYMPSSSAAIKGARDLRGIAYGKLKTAFLYRKKLRKGCACRPKPWTVGERLRHQTYALVAQDELAKGAGDIDDAESAGEVVAARPALIGDGTDADTTPQPVTAAVPTAAARPRLAPRPPSPRIVRRRRRATAPGRQVRYVPRSYPAPRRAKPKAKQNGWGQGGGVLPKVKYRHRWPGQVD